MELRGVTYLRICRALFLTWFDQYFVTHGLKVVTELRLRYEAFSLFFNNMAWQIHVSSYRI